MASDTITIRLSKEEKSIIKKVASMYGASISEFVRDTMRERMEDEFDVQLLEDAIEEYRANPEGYSLEEVEEMLL